MTDPGSLDTETVAWTLTQNGTVIATGTGPSFTFHDPQPARRRWSRPRPPPTATAARAATAPRSCSITRPAPSVVINPSGITVSVGGNPVDDHASAGAGQVIVLVYGSNDLVDAST